MSAMRMEMTPEQSIEMAIARLQEDMADTRRSLEQVQQYVTGGGDPRTGLLWLVADLGKMMVTVTSLAEEQRKAFAQHEREGHERSTPVWQRLIYDTARTTIATVVTVTMLLIALGAQTWLRSQ